jgi:hypothetical protein
MFGGSTEFVREMPHETWPAPWDGRPSTGALREGFGLELAAYLLHILHPVLTLDGIKHRWRDLPRVAPVGKRGHPVEIARLVQNVPSSVQERRSIIPQHIARPRRVHAFVHAGHNRECS